MTTYTHDHIENPNNPVPEDIAAHFRSVREQGLRAQENQQRAARLARPTASERKEYNELIDSSGLLGDVRVEQLKAMRDKTRSRVTSDLRSAPQEAPVTNVQPVNYQTESPTHGDNSFWFASYYYNYPAQMAGSSDLDGVYFTGGPNETDGILHTLYFSVTSNFVVSADRIPQSSSGQWYSPPYALIYGGIEGHTSPGGIFWGGDSWSKCWMHKIQTLRQYPLGAGSNPVQVGYALETETLLFEENQDRLTQVAMPGYKVLPPVTMRNLDLRYDLWAQIEILFEIQVEDGFLWMNPQVQVQTPQWTLYAL